MSIDLIKGIASCHTVAEGIARAYGLSEDSQTDLCSRLLGAVASGDIQARKPDGMERAMIGTDWLAMMPVHHPHVWDEDVNKWLAGKYRYVWVPEGAEQNQGQAAPANHETPAQRRTRWLKELEVAQATGETGALARVHKNELARNPKADRSYMGKQIKVAREGQTASTVESVTPHEPTAHNPFGPVATRYVDGKPAD